MNVKITVLPDWVLFWCAAITIGHRIFIRQTCKDNPVIIEHEKVHVAQIEREGWLKYYLLYLFVFPALWNPWRARWEAEAFAVNVRAGADPTKAAIAIAGWAYLWPCRQDQALALLKEYSK